MRRSIRPQTPEPVDPAELAARLTARVDEALAITENALLAAGSNRQLADWALDVRLALDPPTRP